MREKSVAHRPSSLSDFLVHSHAVFRSEAMFAFQYLKVYNKARSFHIGYKEMLKQAKPDIYVKDELGRASFSIALNIAEGLGKFSKADRRNYFVIARGSVFECPAILDLLHDEQVIDHDRFKHTLLKADERLCILFDMI